MWSDNETAIDLLGFGHLVSAVTSIVRNGSLLPASIGVFGDWGSGKSSLLEMLTADLSEGSNDVLVLSFNGWLFEGYEDTKTALMGSILDEIRDKRSPKDKGLDVLNRLLRRVNWFRLLATGAKHGLAFALAGPAGLGMTAAADLAGFATQAGQKLEDVKIEDLARFLRDEAGQEARRAVREFRADFAELLTSTDIKTLVVVIDDLDRCLPETIIETLEAIKLFLFVPRTAFVIGADERLVKYAVRTRFPELPGEDVEVGRDYLEKLIQFPIRIPPLDAAELETYINLLFAQVTPGLLPNEFDKARRHVVTCDADSLMQVRFNHGVAAEVFNEVPNELAENLALGQQLASVLAAGLSGNPRQCKRFLNTLVMRKGMAESRKLALKQRVLAKLMLLEYFRPEWFRRLAELQAAEDGHPAVLASMEAAVRPKPSLPSKGADGDQTYDGETTETKGPRKKPALSGTADAEGEATDSSDLAMGFQSWLRDTWMRDWIGSEPVLSKEDLRPYYFFSRDALGPMATAVRRMSPRAQEMLSKLLHPSDGVRKVACDHAGDLADADAAALFEALATRVTQEEDHSSDDSALLRLFEWSEARPELRGQAVALLGRLPETRLPLSTPNKVVGLVRGTDAEPAARLLLTRWSNSPSAKRLATASQQALGRLGGP